MPALNTNAQAFEAAVAPYERQVYFTCLRIMGNPQDAEDCAQEAMLKAYHAYAGFRGDSKASTWLYTIATRCCMDALRRRREVVSLDSLREDGWEAQSEEPSPYLALEEGERKRLLGEAITHLPEEHRVVLTLCDLQGLSYEEAAGVIGCPLGTVRSRLNRARAGLRQALSAGGELFQDNLRPIDERRESK